MKVNMDQLTRQGIDAVRHGETDAGRGYLEQAVKVDPKNAIAELWLASIASDNTEHRRHLERVLELDPSHPFALRDLAELNGQPPPRLRHDTTAGAVPSTAVAAAQKPIATPPELRTMTPIAMAPSAVLQAIRETPLPSSSGGLRQPAMPRPTKPAPAPAPQPIKPPAGAAGAATPAIPPASKPVKPSERGATTPGAPAAPATPDATTGRPTFTRPAIAQKPGAPGEAGKMEDAPLWASLMTADDAVAIANRPRSTALSAGAPATAQPADSAAGASMVRTYESPVGKPGARRPYAEPGRGPAIGAAGLAGGAAGMAAGAALAAGLGKPASDASSFGKPAADIPPFGKPASGAPALGKPGSGTPAFERPSPVAPAAAGVAADPDECDPAAEADDETPARPMSRGRLALIVVLLCAAFLIGALGRHLLGPRSQARGGDADPALSGALVPGADTTTAAGSAEAGVRAGSAEQPAAEPQIEAPGEGAAASEQAGTIGDDAPANGQAPTSGDDAPANGQAPAGGDTQADGQAPAGGDAQADGQAPAASGDAQADGAPAGSQGGAAAETQPAPRDTAEEALGTAYLSGPSVTGADIDPLTVIPVWPEPFAATGASTCALPPASPALVLDIRVSANGERAFKIQYRECVGWVAEGYLSSTRGAAQELPADMRNAEPGK